MKQEKTHKQKRRALQLKILPLVFLLWSTPVQAADLSSVHAAGAVLLDPDNGRVLWGKNEEIPLAMASTTKIMTALLVLERTNLDDIVCVSKNASNQPEVHMHLQEGEQFTVENMLYALMLASYNDVAVALAEHVGGTVENFCTMMTLRAEEIGAKKTVFNSPNGLDSHLAATDHVASPEDLALIAAYALTNETFSKIIQTADRTFNEEAGRRQVTVTNANRLLSEYDGAIGMKTGYTNRAGHCFVGAATRDDVTLISTVLASGWGTTGKEAKWTDTKAILDYGFEMYDKYELIESGIVVGEIAIESSPVSYISVVTSGAYRGLFTEDELRELHVEYDYSEILEAPVFQYQKVGVGKLYLGSELLYEFPLITNERADRFDLKGWLYEIKTDWFSWGRQ
ncbi:MAG: D-alanyl-D-alanine carboxypeptidase family protein [Bacillota bacterium]